MEVTVNGEVFEVAQGDSELTLLEWLRERCDLTGAKNGCNIGRCGACTVLVDDRPTLACKTAMSRVEGKKITTIEGLAPAGGLHPLQEAFIDHGAIQCGFCTPGMILRAHGLLLRKPKASREEIKKGISPNLCRCTGYQQIVDAIEAAAGHYRVGSKVGSGSGASPPRPAELQHGSTSQTVLGRSGDAPDRDSDCCRPRPAELQHGSTSQTVLRRSGDAPDPDSDCRARQGLLEAKVEK